MKKLILLALISLPWLTPQTISAEEVLLDQTIAIVENDVILESELRRKVSSILSQLKKQNQQTPPMDIFQTQVLERMIVDSLQLQMAKRAGVRINEQELNAAVEDIAKQNKISLNQLRQSIEKEGINWELFREDLRSEIMVARVRRGQVSRRISISEREVENLVQLMDAEGAQSVQYHLGHILIPISDASDQKVIQEARNKAKIIVDELRAGANFSTLAIQHSSGQEALQGGDFGWRTGAQLPTLFAGPAKALEVGGISDLLRSGSGFHIIKLIEKRGDVKHVVQQVDARHILLIPNAIRDLDASEAQIRKLHARVKKGESFDELAKQFSDDKGSALQGGKLGWNTPDKYVGPFKQSLEKLPLHTLSDPIQTEFGWHIIEVLGRREADQTDDFKKDQAARILQSRKFDEEVEAWLRELRDTSYVEILMETHKK